MRGVATGSLPGGGSPAREARETCEAIVIVQSRSRDGGCDGSMEPKEQSRARRLDSNKVWRVSFDNCYELKFRLFHSLLDEKCVALSTLACGRGASFETVAAHGEARDNSLRYTHHRDPIWSRFTADCNHRSICLASRARTSGLLFDILTM